MFFPWRGLFEQIKLADIYVHYDDVQYPLGRSFMNRVQIKTPHGSPWLAVPLQKNDKQPLLIRDVIIDDSKIWRVSRSGIALIKSKKDNVSHDWRTLHTMILHNTYRDAPFFDEMSSLVDDIYSLKTDRLSELNIYTIEKIAQYFNISPVFIRSSELDIHSQSSEKVLETVIKLNGTVYITGHGALKYLDYDLFEKQGIRVEYIDYRCTPYRQLFGEFTPYVSVLDLIANTGKDGINYINSKTQYWRDFCGK